MALLVTYAIYRAGLNGTWQFDDLPNLKHLDKLQDGLPLWVFVFSSAASELGRPLSMLSFALNTWDWPNHPEAFRHINVLIHLINALLLAWLVLKITQLRESANSTHAVWLAVLAASLWALSPLHVSGIMMAVQRMTLLAGSAVLLGLLGYIHGRALLAAGRRARGLTWMSLSLAAGSTIGVLCKENAALLPLFAGVLEITLLRTLPAPLPQTLWRGWRLAFFAGPLVLLTGYVALTWESISLAGYAFRDFTLSERLASESVILWDYARQMLLPNVGQFGPFHDDTPILDFNHPLVWGALTGWVVVGAIAVALAKRTPWLLFALIWFLTGHLLESTVLPLELYFEHRNYIASVGPILALAAGIIVSIRAISAQVALATLALLMFGAALWQVAPLWGTPILAAEMWSHNHPGSERATQMLAFEYNRAGFRQAARDVLDEAANQAPKAGSLRIQALYIECEMSAPPASTRDRFDTLVAGAAHYSDSSALVETLRMLDTRISNNECGDLSDRDIKRFLDALMQNRVYGGSPRLRHHLHHAYARLAQRAEDHASRIEHLRQAFLDYPSVSGAHLLATTYFEIGAIEQAIEVLDEAAHHAPGTPPARKAWIAGLNNLKAALLDIQQQQAEFDSTPKQATTTETERP
ncbi:MAG: hypothetical protein AB1479_01100 [Pseudomonadota bacterium]